MLVFYYRTGLTREFDTMVEASVNRNLKGDKNRWLKYKNVM